MISHSCSSGFLTHFANSLFTYSINIRIMVILVPIRYTFCDISIELDHLSLMLINWSIYNAHVVHWLIWKNVYFTLCVLTSTAKPNLNWHINSQLNFYGPVLVEVGVAFAHLVIYPYCHPQTPPSRKGAAHELDMKLIRYIPVVAPQDANLCNRSYTEQRKHWTSNLTGYSLMPWQILV